MVTVTKTNSFILFALCSLLISCGSSNTNNTNSIKDSIICIMPLDTIQTKTVEVSEPDENLSKLLLLFTETKELPLAIDEKQIDNLTPKYILKSKEVHLLTDSILQNKLYEGVDYDLSGFYKIDSIKSKGKYKDYKESLDLGQLKDSRAFPLYKLTINTDSYILLWGIDASSYEACPFSWTKIIFASLISKNKLTNTIVFAEHSGGGDAPVSFDRIIRSSISKDLKIKQNLREEQDDGEEPKLELTEGFYELSIANEIFSYILSDKKPPRMIKKKVYN